jgi:hypothetical protein
MLSKMNNELKEMSFHYRDFMISVDLEDDKVILITYLKAGITDEDLETIRAADGNAWKVFGEKDGYKYWIANDILCGTNGTQKLLGNVDVVTVFYRKDLQRLSKIFGVQ